MDINNNTIINVCNYEPCKIIASSNVQDYVFDACEHINAPITVPISAVEIRNIHSRSTIFTDGYLTFDDDIKEDVYKYLKINNWQDILTQSDIIDVILHSNKEKLQKIIDIDSLSYFERVRGVYIALKQSKADISLRVADVIEARYKELRKGKRNSSIELRDVNFQSETDNKETLINDQQKQIDEQNDTIKNLHDELDKLKSMIESLTNQNSGQGENENENENKENNENTKAKRGRPPKSKTTE